MRVIAPNSMSGINSKADFVSCYLENSKAWNLQAPIAQSFNVTSSTPVPATNFAVMTAVPGELLVDGTIVPDAIDFYEFDLTAGETYLFSLFGSGDTPLSDTFLYLLDGEGNLVDVDDDGGASTNSLLTFTATSSGTYYIGAAAYPESGLSGSYTFDAVVSPGIDVVGDTFVDAAPLTIGEVTYGFIDSGEGVVYGPDFGEVDTYSFTAVAGTVITFEVAGGADYASDWSALLPGELDTRIAIYDSEGNLVASNDDISFPGDISSRTSFIVPDDGTYYLDVYSWAPSTGGYSITSETVNIGDVDPLDSLNWFSAANVEFDDTNTAYVYFGAADENFGEEGPSFGWNDYEIQQVMLALEEYEHILGVNYEITTDVDAATFRLFTTTSTQFGAYFYPQDPGYGTQQGVGAFNVNSGGWDKDGVSTQNIPGEQISLVQGGYSFAVILHEFGHAHGIAHPHDNGGGSEVMLGVTGADSLGIFDLNQGVYTVMSYNDGWQNHPDGPHNFTIANLDHGWSGSLSAFDIAILQLRYGVSAYAEGDDIYTLRDVNEQGTYYQTIWDSAGIDAIAYDGERDAQIDLLAATLDYSATGGGVLSYVREVFGGFTIAAGVVIENASGGSGDDTLLGNDADNELDGNAGDDMLFGRGGDDTLIGRAGANSLTGGAGADTFVIDGTYKGTGTSLISDFDSTSDTIDLVGMARMKIVFEQSGDDTLIAFDSVGMATLENTDAMEVLANSDFFSSPKSTTLIVDGVVVPLQIVGTEANNKLEGKAGATNTIAGLAGDDVINGMGKDDMLFGNTGDDVLNGGNGRDKLYGGRDNDKLYGGNGNDTLKGEKGDDLLSGGNGLDELWGGEGSDIFLFDVGNKKAGIDTVKDYDVLEDELLFTTAPLSVTFADTASGARMYVNGTLTATFEGLTASEMAGEWVI